jgi:hypothetical protein
VCGEGTSWFGFETANEFPHGLWSVSADDIFGFLRNNSFNAVRLPVSAKLVLDPNKKVRPPSPTPSFLPPRRDTGAHCAIVVHVVLVW